MIPASPDFKAVLRTALELSGEIRLLAEWNMNRFSKPVVSNGSEVERSDFPLSSMAEPNRPTKGIVKVIAGEGFVQPEYMNSVPDARFYISSDDDIYRYWSSVQTADELNESDTYSFADQQIPSIVYPAPVKTNKLVIGVETSLASPVSLSVQTTTNGVTWSTAMVNPTINDDGQIVLYLQSGGGWGATPYYDNVQSMRGIRLAVNTMDEPFSRLSVIEMSLRLERDLSAYVIDWESSFELSDVSVLTPIGRASSNVASVTLSNGDRHFNNENPDSLYYGLIDKNVKMTLDFGLKLPSGAVEHVRQFKMYTENFAPSDDMVISARLVDSSTYLQSVTIPSLYLEGLTIGAIIWKLMDAAGFNNYYYNVKEDDSQVVPFFWTDGTKSLWDEIAGLAETTQTAVYFDENDIMRIRTKSDAFDVERDVDWDLRATSVPGLLANVESLSQDRVFETNKLDVSYFDTGFSDFNNGLPKMEVSWEPEDTMVLRAATIVKPILSNTEYITIDQQKSITWPYSGIVNIEGEMIRYEGKHYYYYDRAGVLKEAVLTSQDEKEAIDNPPLPPGMVLDNYQSWRNYFSGNLKITGRGAMNTQVKNHTIYTFDPNANGPRYVGEYMRFFTSGPIYFTNRAKFDNQNGHLTLSTDAQYSTYDMYIVQNGHQQDLVPYGNFGTRVKFRPDGYPGYGIAGLHFSGGRIGQGFYIGLHTTAHAESAGRAWNEIGVWVKNPNGSMQQLGNPAANIERGVWYDLEAKVVSVGAVSDPNKYYRLSVFLNGTHVGTYPIPLEQFENLGQSGLFVRGHCIADFEYFYAFDDGSERYALGGVDGMDDPENRDSPGGQFLDVIYGGYRSNTVYSRIKNNWIWSVWDHRFRQVGNFFFDEFTPVVHEVREIDVSFKDAPVMHSYPYLTNDSQAMILEYNSDPFRGRLVVANASRADAIVNGEDAVTFGPNNPVNQKIMIYGRLITQEEAQHIYAENEDSIRKRGKIETQIESKWIQTEKTAKSISDWVVKTFGYGADEITAEVFANPILQLGDLVTVSHPGFNMSTSTHKYFVTSVTKSWDDGLSTSLGLKRIKI